MLTFYLAKTQLTGDFSVLMWSTRSQWNDPLVIAAQLKAAVIDCLEAFRIAVGTHPVLVNLESDKLVLQSILLELSNELQERDHLFVSVLTQIILTAVIMQDSPRDAAMIPCQTAPHNRQVTSFDELGIYNCESPSRHKFR